MKSRTLIPVLVGGLFLVPTGAVQATADCSQSNGDCTFPDSSDTLLVHTYEGSEGNKATPGGDGENLTYTLPSELNVGIPVSSAFQGVYIKQQGGEGSTGTGSNTPAPSPGGAGGDITFDQPNAITVTVNQNLDISDAAAAVLLWSQGGNGNDDNENDGSDGGPGGVGGNISSAGYSTSSVSLLGSFANVSNTNDFVGVELRSYGGNGGRVNEQSNKGTLYGGDGGNGGTIEWRSGSVTVGTAQTPLVADSVVGVRLRSIGGRGPNQYNNGDDQGGGGSSSGGAGGQIDFENVGPISVFGKTNAYGGTFGVYAYSQGGEGGWAYNVGDAEFFTPGGNGGDGGPVTVDVDDTLSVTDTGSSASPYGSAAVYALSAGGTGGVGQHDNSGGHGGHGGSVTVDVKSDSSTEITATGINVDAIKAKSVGGQGGDGLEGDDGSANDSSGGTGGNGGSVTVTVSLADDQTIAAQASPAGHDSGRGIVAQSLSGLGGTGSDGNAVFGEPGGGGAGGDGGPVTVTINGGTITTDGTNDLGSGLDYAAGISAQSIGGGGGDGGDFTGFLGGKGGAGGTGGTGDEVTITNHGVINPNGAQAYGILAQSIGGGGGAGGSAKGLVVALGGSGGTGGTSGTVAITNDGHITTHGYNAAGILAQSIVGGGGAAGTSGGAISIGGKGGDDSGTTAGTVKIANTGSITTVGDAAAAILAQSIAGGGGSAAAIPDTTDSSVGILAIGADGGGGGAGGQVSVTALGTLSTEGEFAPGLQAQSIGGGGGSGGNAFSIGVLVPSGAVGGQSGGGGNGGTVEVSNTDPVSVTTNGVSSAGLLLQSIGGGGGSGGNATAASALAVFQLGIGGAAKGAGAGGSVTATLSDATIETQQSQSAGIVAQSIGGGGGSGGSGTTKAAGFLNVGFSMIWQFG